VPERKGERVERRRGDIEKGGSGKKEGSIQKKEDFPTDGAAFQHAFCNVEVAIGREGF